MVISAFVVACVALMPGWCPVESGVALLIDGGSTFPSERVMGRAVLGADDRIDGLLKSMILSHATYAEIAQVPD